MIIQIGFQDEIIGTGTSQGNDVSWSGDTAQLEVIADRYARKGLQGQALLGKIVSDMHGHWWAKEVPSADFNYKFASTQVNLPPELAEQVISLAKAIPDADIGDDGREDTPHCTLQYGFTSDDPAPVVAAASDFGPVRLRILKLSLFPASDKNPQDVLKFDVVSDDLHRLKAKLAHVPHEDKWPVYRPHITVAYLKPGQGEKYLKATPLDGQEVTIRTLLFNSTDEKTTEIPLAPAPADLFQTLEEVFATLFAHDVSGQVRDDRGRWTSSGSHEISGIESDVVGHLKKMLGHDVSEHDVAALAGAPHGTHVTAEVIKSTGDVYISFHNAHCKGERLLILNEGKPYIQNESFDVLNPTERGEGLGTQMLAGQVSAAVKHGFDRIETVAGGFGSDLSRAPKLSDQANRKSGFYAWARMGYDGPLSADQRREIGTLYPAKTIHELMAMPGAAARWKQIGSPWHAVFDLKAGSRSRAILRAYASAKGITADFAADLIDGGLLSPEDDEILDRIWKFVQEHGWDALETAEFGKPFDASEWAPHVITKGPRKGMQVFKNSRTGALIDALPEKSPKSEPAATSGIDQTKVAAVLEKYPELAKAASEPVSKSLVGILDRAHPSIPGGMIITDQFGLTGPNLLLPTQSRPQISPNLQLSINKFSGDDHEGINIALRSGTPLSAEQSITHNNLQVAFSKCEVFKEPVIVRRGISFDNSVREKVFLDRCLAAEKSKLPVVFGGYLSTTTDKQVDSAFEGHEMIIKALSGLDVQPYSELPREHELLLNCFSQLRVDKVVLERSPYAILKDDYKYVIHCTQLPETAMPRHTKQSWLGKLASWLGFSTSPSKFVDTDDSHIKSFDSYDEYKQWCESQGIPVLIQQNDAAEFARWSQEIGPRKATRWRNLDNPGAKPRYDQPSLKNHEIVNAEDPSTKGMDFTNVDKAAISKLQAILGRPVHHRDIALLAGAQPGAKVYAGVNQKGNVDIAFFTPDCSASRTIMNDKPPWINNTHFDVKPPAQGQNIGTRMLVTQVSHAAKFGIGFIKTIADGAPPASGKGKADQAGYYAWARLGYDGEISIFQQHNLGHPFSEANTIRELFAMPGGPARWKKKGSKWAARFDLTPGSRSRAILGEYAKAKGIQVDFSMDDIDVTHSGIIDDDDERILEAIWNKIQTQGWESIEQTGFNKPFDPSEWEPHVIKRGPRKETPVYRNTRTGAYRDELPTSPQQDISLAPAGARPVETTQLDIMDVIHLDSEVHNGVEVTLHPQHLQELRQCLGPAFQPADLVKMAGSPPPGGYVVASSTPTGLSINARGPGGWTMSCILHTNQEPVHLEDHLMMAGDNPPGTGSRMFANQVKSAAQWGVHHIEMDASGKGDGTMNRKVAVKPGEPDMNGYYTWPRLGCDAEIPDSHRSALTGRYREAKTLSQLFAMPDGNKEWYRHGSVLRVTFDLTPGSHCHAVLDAYLKAANMTFSAEDDPVPCDGSTLSVEDEAILDKIWKQIQTDGWESIGAVAPFNVDTWQYQDRDDHGRWGTGNAVHAHLVEHSMKFVDQHLDKATDIPVQTKAIMREAFGKVFRQMSQSAILKFHERCLGISFYKDVNEVTNAYRRQGQLVKRGQIIGAFCVTEPRALQATLHVNTAEKAGMTMHNYAHEIGHLLDSGRLVANSDAWRSAWTAEINHPHDPISHYATKDVYEGLAEFHRGVIVNPRQAREDFPKCWAVFQQHGFV